MSGQRVEFVGGPCCGMTGAGGGSGEPAPITMPWILVRRIGPESLAAVDPELGRWAIAVLGPRLQRRMQPVGQATYRPARTWPDGVLELRYSPEPEDVWR